MAAAESAIVTVAANVTPVETIADGSDGREEEIAEMARRAALAASDRRRRARQSEEITAEDVDQQMVGRLGKSLETIAAWAPGFAGAMLFRGPSAQPLVSLVTAGDQEAVRRALSHVASTARAEVDLIERDAFGSFVDSVTSTSRGAILALRFDDDLLIVAIEGQPALVADAWQAIRSERDELRNAASGLIKFDAGAPGQ